MNPFKNHLLIINTLSIDIALGAVVSAGFFAKLSGSPIDYPVYTVLGLVVLIIYNVDHLLDVKFLDYERTSIRHEFFYRNYKPMLIMVVVLLAITFVVSLLLPTAILKAGAILGVLVVCYLVFHRKLKFSKEVIGAMIYVVGILIPSIETGIKTPLYIYVLVFFITVLINLILFSWFDFEMDKHSGQYSVMTLFGKRTGEYAIVILSLLQLMLFTYIFHEHSGSVEWFVLLMMNVMLIAIFLFRFRLKSNDLYRLLGDSIFYFPVVLFII